MIVKQQNNVALTNLKNAMVTKFVFTKSSLISCDGVISCFHTRRNHADVQYVTEA